MSKSVIEQPSKAKRTKYKCSECEKIFSLKPEEEKKCKYCGNTDEINLEILEQQLSETVESLYNEDDFHGG